MPLEPADRPLGVRVSCDRDADRYQLSISAGAGTMVFSCSEPMRRKNNPWEPGPAAKADFDAARSPAASAFTDQVERWLGLSARLEPTVSNDRVECGHDGFSTARDARGTPWTSVHLVFSRRGRFAGLHVQFVEPGGAGLLLESHLGSAAELIGCLRALAPSR